VYIDFVLVGVVGNGSAAVSGWFKMDLYGIGFVGSGVLCGLKGNDKLQKRNSLCLMSDSASSASAEHQTDPLGSAPRQRRSRVKKDESTLNTASASSEKKRVVRKKKGETLDEYLDTGRPKVGVRSLRKKYGSSAEEFVQKNPGESAVVKSTARLAATTAFLRTVPKRSPSATVSRRTRPSLSSSSVKTKDSKTPTRRSVSYWQPNVGDMVGGNPSTTTKTLWAGSSRYPSSWKEVCEQAARSSRPILDTGNNRVLIEINHANLKLSAEELKASLTANVRSVLELAVQVYQTCFHDNKQVNTMKIFFNTEADRVAAESVFEDVVPAELRHHFPLASLDAGKIEDSDDGAFVACPRNTDGNPARIEKVERVHYENWSRPRPVIMLNPDLVVLTLYGLRENRRPCFLADYDTAFSLNQNVFNKDGLEGALLYAHPRSWEVYIRYFGRGETVHRFAKQYASRPPLYMVQSELSRRLSEPLMIDRQRPSRSRKRTPGSPEISITDQLKYGL